MGRGSTDQRDMAKQQFNADNARLAQAQAERTEGRNKLLPEVNSLLGSEGYSPEEKASRTRTSMESLDTGLDSGVQQINNRTAVTRNSAGAPAALAELARQRAIGRSDTAGQLDQSFADEKERRRAQGRALLASLYGMDSSAYGNLVNAPHADLSAHAAGIAPGFGDYFTSLLSSAAGGVGSYYGAKGH